MAKENKRDVAWAIVITITTIPLALVSILMGAHGGIERSIFLCFLASPVLCWLMFVRNSAALLYYLVPAGLLGIGWVALVGWD